MQSKSKAGTPSQWHRVRPELEGASKTADYVCPQQQQFCDSPLDIYDFVQNNDMSRNLLQGSHTANEAVAQRHCEAQLPVILFKTEMQAIEGEEEKHCLVTVTLTEIGMETV